MVRLLLAFGVLAGCAAPPALLPMGDMPAPEASQVVSLRPLDAVQQPDVPPALRATSARPMDASSMVSHTHAQSLGAPLGDALTAYLLIHAALASDTVDGIADAARAFQAAFALAIQAAPAGDPHVWHMRSAETAAVQVHASALAEAPDLVRARDAFGALSAPLASLVEAVGLPDGFDLVRHTCGMQPDAPEGGVWLQRTGEVQNPYFGGTMQMCALSPGSESSEAEVSTHHGMSHGS